MSYELWVKMPGKKTMRGAWDEAKKEYSGLLQAMREDMGALRKRLAAAELKAMENLVDESNQCTSIHPWQQKEELRQVIEKIVDEKLRNAFGKITDDD